MWNTCKAITVWRKAATFAAVLTQSGPVTLLRRYVEVEDP